MRKYVTALGDTWDIIAYKMYGNERQMSTLIEANTIYREIVIFPAEISIKVPDIDPAVSVSLPPWKR